MLVIRTEVEIVGVDICPHEGDRLAGCRLVSGFPDDLVIEFRLGLDNVFIWLYS